MIKFLEWLTEFLFPTYKVEEQTEADFGIYYVVFRGKRILEFETLEDAKDYCDMMNSLYFGVTR